MADAQLTDLLSGVMPLMLSDPSRPLVESVIRRTVREFCARSRVWQVVTDPMNVTAGVRDVDLDVPMGATVVAVLSLNLGGPRLEPVSSGMWLHSDRYDDRTGEPRCFTQLDTEQVILLPTPDTTRPGALVATLALQPSLSATTFPGWILDRYEEALASGTAAKLMLMPQRAWSDPNTGVDLRARFEAAIANASGTAVTGPGPLRTTSQH